MFDKLSRSWDLVKASAAVLRSDKELMLFPAISGLCTLVVMATFLIPVFGVLWGAWLLDEPLSMAHLYGGLLIGAALWLVLRPART